jgi:murein DD-endopeptidase MepM/ murein hydrolase activator NlpD
MVILITAMFQDAPIFETITERLRAAHNEQKFDAVHSLFNPEMSAALPPEKTKQFFSDLLSSHGKWTKSGQMKVQGRTAIIPARFERGSLNVTLTLDDQGKIAGLVFLPAAPSLPVPERNSMKMLLPFRSEWLVFWGGDTEELNHHVVDEPQRRAFDLVVVDQAGKTHRGDGFKNQDFFSWGQEILAPADGLVVEAIDGVRDNEPGKMNTYSIVGNAVFLEHAKNQVSLLAHLQRGSVRPKAGDRVKRGDLLGLCGNSGNSSEPHLHFHLMNTPMMQDGTGVKVFFERLKVTREGKTEEREDYSPIKGDRIAP